MGKKHSYFDVHKKPSSRREFLASGMMGFSAFMMTPSILGILTNSSVARAATDSCDASSSGPALPAFVALNLAGGASLSGNVIVHDKGGQLLPAYNQLGLGTAPQTETEFGNVLFPSASSITTSFLTGMRSQANGALAKSAFISVCVPLADDTSNNAIDPTGMVTAAGLVGTLLPNLGSNNRTGTGISQKASNVQPPSPLVVQSISDLTTALAPASSLTANLNVSQQQSLLSLVSDLSGQQARKVAAANSSSGSTLSKLVQCATGKNVALATQTNPGIDPKLDSDQTVTNLWQMNAGGDAFGRSQNERTIMGSMVYNGLKGNAGAVGLELGGYDYHGAGATSQNQKDFEAGALVGKILATAQAMNKKVFINITSDGSVGADPNSGLRPGFTSDRGSGGMMYMIAFDPAGRPAIKNDRTAAWQLGYFTAGQGAADDSLVGAADKAGVAAFANYLAFAKQTSAFGKSLVATLDGGPRLHREVRVMREKTKRTKQIWLSAGAAAALVLVQLFAYQNCGSDFVVKDGVTFVGSSSVCESTLASDFQSSYYPFLKTNCATCHTGKGPGNGAFADGNADIAFAAFLTAGTTKIDMNATNTAHSGNSGPQNTSAIAVAGQQWDNAEATCKGGGAGPAVSLFTKEKVMQAGATAKDIVWNLDSELNQPGNSGGAVLTIAVQESASANGTPVYFFSNPRLKAGTRTVQLKGLMVRINGQEQALGSTWSRTDATVAPGTTMTLSTAQMILEYPAYSVSDTLSMSINSVTAQ